MKKARNHIEDVRKFLEFTYKNDEVLNKDFKRFVDPNLGKFIKIVLEQSGCISTQKSGNKLFFDFIKEPDSYSDIIAKAKELSSSSEKKEEFVIKHDEPALTSEEKEWVDKNRKYIHECFNILDKRVSAVEDIATMLIADNKLSQIFSNFAKDLIAWAIKNKE